MKILIIGSGMYVTGRNGTGPGTILSSLAELSRTLPIDSVHIAARATANAAVVQDAAARINTLLGTNLTVTYETLSGNPAVDAPRLLKTDYACAIVSVPDHLHYSWTTELLRGKRHCLVVKPLTPTLHEASSLEQLRATQGVYGAVEFHKRWDATNRWVRRELQANRLGKLLYFTVDYSQRISIPMTAFREWAGQTNIFQYLGVHYVDIIHFVTGYLPIRASALGTQGALQAQGIDTWDSVHATIVWAHPAQPADTFVSQFSTNWIDPVTSSAMSDQKYKVIGTRGRIECDQKHRGLELVHADSGIQHANPYFADFLPDEEGRMHFGGYGFDSIRQFILDVRELQAGRTTPDALATGRPTFRQALISTAVIDAVNRSLRQHGAWQAMGDMGIKDT